MTGVSRVRALLGGMHLRGGPADDRAVAALVGVAEVLVQAYCTGWRAQPALAAALPAAFVPTR